MGGDWILDVATGPVGATLADLNPAVEQWRILLANTVLDWSTVPLTNLLTGTNASVRDSITVTSSGASAGSASARTMEIRPTGTHNGHSGIVYSSMDATTDNGTVSQTTTFVFSEPVYNLTFTVIDIDGGTTRGWNDIVQFGSDNGFPTATFTGSNVSYNATTGRATSNGASVGDTTGDLTLLFAGPVNSVTIQFIAGNASGSNPGTQIISIDDLTFNTPPDALANARATPEGSAVSGNVVTDDDGSGTDTDRQDGTNLAVNRIEHGSTTLTVSGSTVLTLANGATLTIAPGGGYTFDPNGAYDALGLGQSATEVFTYRIQDLQGLYNEDGTATDSVATLTITIDGEADYAFSLSKSASLANVSSLATIAYTIAATNTGDTAMSGVSVSDLLAQGAGTQSLSLSGPSGDNAPLGSFDVGETWTYTASHAVTQANLDNGANLVNTATFGTAELAAQNASATTTITQSPSFAVTKTADDTTDVPAGQTVIYTYVVTNTGNITLDNVALSESHNGSGPDPAPSGETLNFDAAPLGDSSDATANNGVWSTLAPGDSVTFTGAYLVTQADIDSL
jgi:uncharacterized repeat protein (TIGR01451 family)